MHKQCGATALVRDRQHREARQGCPIWAVRCMWDRRHGHVFTTCFLAGHPTSSAQPPPAGKPELTNFSSFACSPLPEPPLLKETMGPSQRTAQCALCALAGPCWLGLGLMGATDCGLKSESRAQTGQMWPCFPFRRPPPPCDPYRHALARQPHRKARPFVSQTTFPARRRPGGTKS